MDMLTVSTLLSSLKTASELAKLIKDSDVTLEKAESKLKLAELISALADARIEVANIQEALQEKDAEIRSLKERKVLARNIQWVAPYYFLVDGDKRSGPFCQQCYDKEKELIRLQGYNNGYWDCKACKNDFRDASFDSSPSLVVSYRDDPFSDH